MKTKEITLALAPDEAAALEALARDQYLDALEVAAEFLLRDALVAQGHLVPLPDTSLGPVGKA